MKLTGLCFTTMMFACALQTTAQPAAALASYSSEATQEKVYLRTDRELYLAGEIIWFSLYNLNASDHRFSELSKIAYVELLDAANRPVVSAKIELEKGSGQGSLYLPVTVGTGAYQLRAYTNWMKNEGPDYFYNKTTWIVNTLKGSDATEENTEAAPSLTVFPEGGNLVNGVESRIAFKVEDISGHGLEARGYLISGTDTLQELRTVKTGMGSFDLIPDQNKNYRVAMLAEGESDFVSANLPNVFTHGYVMHAEKNGNSVNVNVFSNVRSSNNVVTLVSHTRGTNIKSHTASVQNGKAAFTVPVNQLQPGINHFTLFNNAGEAIAERLWFKAPEKTVSLNATGNKTVYATRDEVNISLNGLAAAGSDSRVSVSVIPVDALEKEREDIAAWLYLSSDLRGSIESASDYLTDDAAADLLMMTHGWRRFRWEDVLTNKFPAKSHAPEIRGQIIKGRVVVTGTGEAAAGIPVYLAVPGKNYKFYAAVSDESGIVLFDVKDHYGNQNIMFQPKGKDGVSYRVDLVSPFSEEYRANRLPVFTLNDEMSDLLLQRSIGMQALNVYAADSLRKFYTPPFEDSLPFFGRADYTYLLDEYKRFTTMEEVLREYVRAVNVGVGGGKLHFKMYNEPRKELNEDGFLVLLDGIPLLDPDKIFAYDPLKVQKIEVYPRGYIVGPSVFRGITSFKTYEGNYNGFNLDPSMVLIDHEGLQMQREFYTPRYSTLEQKASRIPDLRHTLYWVPQLAVEGGKAQLNFYTGDKKGKYLVIAEGLTGDGTPVHGEFSFEVK